MKLQIVKDVLGNDYIGIDVDINYSDCHEIKPITFISQFTDKVFNANTFNANLLKRNHNKYHITAFNVAECNKNKDLFKYVNTEIDDITYNGIGSISKDEAITYYIICQSLGINALRVANGLVEKDLHITIGFHISDLFHKKKDISTLLSI